MHDLIFPLLFYVSILALTIFSYPFVFSIFGNLADRGYLFSKMIAVLMIGYLYFLALACGLLKTPPLAYALIFAAFITPSILILRSSGKILRDFIVSKWKLLVLEEVIFLTAFAVFILIKMGDPAIYGAESFPDFNLYNRIVIGDSFPPVDNWLSFHPVNYYYLGHLALAAITRITTIPTNYGYNIMLAFIAACIFVFSFAIAHDLTRKKLLGLASGISVALLGNLGGFLLLFSMNKYSLYWWEPSRVIEGTINEFPYFSFLLGDLHAHFISLPLTLCFIGACLNIYRGSSRIRLTRPLKFGLPGFLEMFILSLLGGFVLSSNPWYFPVMIVIFLLAFFISETDQGKSHLNAFSGCALSSTVIVLTSALLFLPFLLNYSPPVSGFGIVPAKLTSDLQEFFIMFGFPVTVVTFYLMAGFVDSNKKEILPYAASVLFLALIILMLRYSIVSSALFLILAVNLYLLVSKKIDFPILLTSIFIFILLLCEFVFLKDTYGPKMARMNTVFKFHYLSYSVMMLLVPVIFYLSLKRIKRRTVRVALSIICLILLIMSIAYPVVATLTKPTGIKPKDTQLTLDGMSFLSGHLKPEREAVSWLKNKTDKDGVILEASGKPYDYFSRFSTFTGRPTVLGWGNHERVWRGDLYEETEKRSKDIDNIYSSTDKRRIVPLLEKYDIKYVIVGIKEKEIYPEISLKAFGEVMEKVYDNGSVAIYRAD